MAKKRKHYKKRATTKKRSKTKKRSDDMDKGQMWSVDVIIGIVIFISVITIFYTTLSGSNRDVRSLLKGNADTIITKFSQDPNLQVIEEGNLLNTTMLDVFNKLPSSITCKLLKKVIC